MLIFQEETNMFDNLNRYISEGRYAEAEILVSSEDRSLREVFLNMAYDTESIAICTFLIYMYNKHTDTIWLDLIIEIMLNPLCHIEGAYSVALFYARELVRVSPSVRNREQLLFFYQLPEKLISEDEAIEVSKEILKQEPDNMVAKKVLYSL